MTRISLAGALLTALPFAIGSVSAQRVLNVPANYATIQAAIDAAGTGDTVLVAPGTYAETIDFKGKAIIVQSSTGANTTIDAGGRGSVVTFRSGETRASVLRGFALRGGAGTVLPSGRVGGGIFCDAASPTIVDNVISSNRVSIGPGGRGGGIYCAGGAPLIDGNGIGSNEAYDGGGIHCDAGSTAVMSGNSLGANRAFGSGGGIACVNSSPRIEDNSMGANNAIVGGGIACTASSPRIQNNVITSNGSLTAQGGGVVLMAGSDAVLVNNVIAGNNAIYFGAGILSIASSPTLVNNTIWSNSLLFAPSYGGGMHVQGGTVRVFNTVLFANVGMHGEQLSLVGGAVVEIEHSDVERRASGVFVESGATLRQGAGMIDADPLFIRYGPSGHYLAWNSPCRNAGSNAAPHLPTTDFEGDPRADGLVDIGADEFSPRILLSNGIRIYGEPGAGTFWGFSAVPTLRQPPLSLPGLRGALWLQAPFGVLPLGPMPATGAHVIPGGPRPTLDVPMQALVGAHLTNAVVVRGRGQ